MTEKKKNYDDLHLSALIMHGSQKTPTASGSEKKLIIIPKLIQLSDQQLNDAETELQNFDAIRVVIDWDIN